MESKHGHIANRSYEDFDPVFKWRKEEARDTIELHLPGFRRDQIRIKINHLGFLVISGERPLDGTRWKRFNKEFEIPRYCNEDAIHGNFMQGILSVMMPKKTPLIFQEQEQIPELEYPKEKAEKEKISQKKVEFREHGIAEKNERKTEEELTEKDTQKTQHTYAENEERLSPETTRDVAFKFMVVMIMILVLVNYIADISKSLVAEAQSYFNN